VFKGILVAYDGSRDARAALGIGIELAKRTGARLASVSIEEALPRYAATISEVESAKEEIDAHFQKLTKEARDRALLAGVELETEVRQGHEVDAILAVAREGKFDLLVLGYQGHSRLFERIMGSTALSLVRLAPCSVLIARPRATPGGTVEPFKRILVGLDGSPLGRLAFQAGLDLAILFGGAMTGVTVREGSPLARPEALNEPYIQQLRQAAAEHAGAAGVRFEHMARAGHAGETLSDEARKAGADLIVIGATGLEHPWSSTIGGTATHVVSEAPCAVLLVRSPQAILHVRDVMVRGVSSVTPDTPLAEVVELLLRRNVKALPVVDAGRHVVGIITGGDLLRHGGIDLRLSIQQELDADTLRERLLALARSEKSARDVLTRHVRTVGAELDLASAIRLMAAHGVKRLPVVDRRGELIGIVSRADVLRAIAALSGPAVLAERGIPAHARTVGDALTTDIPVVPPEARAEEVLVKLLESPLRRVVVVGADGRVLGLISDRDLLLRSSPDTRPWLLRALTGRRAPHPLGKPEKVPASPGAPLTAAELVAPSLITIRPEETLAHAIRLMMQHRVKRLVVVDDIGRFVGLVDRRAVLEALVSGGPTGRGS
jgi:CBS domain-containing protein